MGWTSLHRESGMTDREFCEQELPKRHEPGGDPRVKPYYEDDQVRLFLGDMREVLPALGVSDSTIARWLPGRTQWTVRVGGVFVAACRAAAREVALTVVGGRY